MSETGRFVYRGTTHGWPWNPVLQRDRRTCATTDPLVATLFAIECLQHGSSAVLIASLEDFDGLIGPTNHAAIAESEVVLNLPPLDFARRASLEIDAQRSRDILVDMGFDRLPVRIGGKSALRDSINQSYNDGDRLSPDQIQEFNRRAMETSS